MLKANKTQIQIAKQRTVEEKTLYAEGNGQISFLISAQNNEQSAKLNYMKTARNYQKSVLEYKASIDQLVR